MYSKEQLDKMATKAFAVEDIEKNVDIGFDPMDVVTGDPDAMTKFRKLHAEAQEDR